MKKIAVLFISATLLAFTSCSNDDDNNDLSLNQVPDEVLLAFETQFSNATDVDYERFGDQYIIDFDINTIDHEALYNSDGTLVKYKYDILNSAVPEAIQTTIANDYDNRPIDDAEALIIDSNTYYQIELNNTPNDDKIVFNTDGTVNSEIVYWD